MEIYGERQLRVGEERRLDVSWRAGNSNGSFCILLVTIASCSSAWILLYFKIVIQIIVSFLRPLPLNTSTTMPFITQWRESQTKVWRRAHTSGVIIVFPIPFSLLLHSRPILILLKGEKRGKSIWQNEGCDSSARYCEY